MPSLVSGGPGGVVKVLCPQLSVGHRVVQRGGSRTCYRDTTGRCACYVGAWSIGIVVRVVGAMWCSVRATVPSSSRVCCDSSSGIEPQSSVDAIGDVAMRQDWSLVALGVVVQVGFARSE